MASSKDPVDKFTALPLEMLRHIAGYLDLWNRLKLRMVFPKAQENVVIDLVGDALKTIHVSPNSLSLANFDKLTRARFFQTRIENLIYFPVVFCSKGKPEDDDQQIGNLEDFRKINPALSRFEAQRSFEIYQAFVHEHEDIDSKIFDEVETSQRKESIIKQLKIGMCRLPNLSSVSIALYTQSRGINASCCMFDTPLRRQMHAAGLNDRGSNDLIAAAMSAFDSECYMAFAFVILTILPDIKKLSSLAIGDGMTGQLAHSSTFRDSFDIKPLERSLANVTRLTISCEYDYNGGAVRTDERWSILARHFKALQELTVCAEGKENEEYDDWCDVSKGARALDSFLKHGDYTQLVKVRLEGSCYSSGVNMKLFERFLFGHRHVLKEIELNNILLVNSPQDGSRLLPDSAYKDLRDFLLETTWLKAIRKFEMKLAKHGSSDQHQDCLNCSKLPQLATELNVPLKEDTWDFGEVVMRSKAMVD